MVETISGLVEHIIFRNEDTGYTVLVLSGDGQEITCVGTFQYMNQGEQILDAVDEFKKVNNG